MVLAFTFLTLNTYAQMGGMGGGMGSSSMGRGGGMGGQGGGGAQRSVSIDFLASVGYFEIDVNEALKKLKLKGDKESASAVAKAIGEYNAEYVGLMITHRNEIDVLEYAKDDVEDMQSDMGAMRELMTRVSESARVVKPILVGYHNDLNHKIEAIFKDNPKALKRWEKFYRNKCEEYYFNPKMPDRGPEQGQEGQEGQEGRGQGGPGGGQGSSMGGGRMGGGRM